MVQMISDQLFIIQYVYTIYLSLCAQTADPIIRTLFDDSSVFSEGSTFLLIPPPPPAPPFFLLHISSIKILNDEGGYHPNPVREFPCTITINLLLPN